MLRLYLIILGILVFSSATILVFGITVMSPSQLMEWTMFAETENIKVTQESPQEANAEFPISLPLSNEPEAISKDIDYKVPFTSQAPNAEWDDQRYQDGCEEATVLMAIKAVRGETLSRSEATKEIAKISQFELEKFGSFVDTSASSTLDRLVMDYFEYMGRVEYGIDKDDILEALYSNNLVLVPTNGIKLANPYYSPPGPERHMLVIKGYKVDTDEFITNDPGTRNGANYKYDSETLLKALFDYPTGDHVPATAERTAMIVIPW